MNLSENLKKIRKDNNLSQEQLADKLGVSRQSVSKWESGLAYPEMDKMLQLCKLFNLNIDELLNKDINEVNESKQSKNKENKYIDDFLDFITKTINLFSNIPFKEKVKCIFEQFAIAICLVIAFAIVGSIAHILVYDLLSILPYGLQYSIANIIKDIYVIIAVILGLVIMIHIFKVRYLDYYIIEKEEINEDLVKEETEKLENKDKNIIDSKKQDNIIHSKQKIVIRDPEHSGYKVLSLMLKGILYFTKFIVGCFGLGFCFTLIGLVCATVLIFLISKTGLLFIGLLLIFISSVIINILLLEMIYNFIVGKNNKKKAIVIVFFTSLITIGIGSGMASLGALDFEYIEKISDQDYVIETKVYPENSPKNLYIDDNYNVEYVEELRSDIKVDFIFNKQYELSHHEFKNTLWFYINPKNDFDFVKQIIKDINNKKIIDYSDNKIIVYASKENIEKIRNHQFDEADDYNDDLSENFENNYE